MAASKAYGVFFSQYTFKLNKWNKTFHNSLLKKTVKGYKMANGIPHCIKSLKTTKNSFKCNGKSFNLMFAQNKNFPWKTSRSSLYGGHQGHFSESNLSPVHKILWSSSESRCQSDISHYFEEIYNSCFFIPENVFC